MIMVCKVYNTDIPLCDKMLNICNKYCIFELIIGNFKLLKKLLSQNSIDIFFNFE